MASNTEQRRRTAGHEAGHAVVARHFDIPVSRITIGGDQGVAWTYPFGSPREMATVALAGLAADVSLLDMDPAESHSCEDLDYARTLVAEDEITSLTAAACRILQEHYGRWLRLTERLITADELNAAEVAEVLS